MSRTKIHSPFDNQLLGEIRNNTAEEIESYLQSAYDLFENKSRHIPIFDRKKILLKVADLMEESKADLIEIAVLEGGKPYKDTDIEVDRAINGVRIAAEYLNHHGGTQIPMNLTPATQNRLAFTVKEPIGVVFSISAFNHPVNLVIHQTVTAFAAGCPVIIKPARKTPLSCQLLMKIYRKAGLAEDWCRMILCGNELTEKIVSDKRINYVSFIGSADIGWKLRSKLAEGTRCALEHGGSAPVIVAKDANLEKVIPAIVKGGFYHAGQVCVSVQRVFVHSDLLQEFLDSLIPASRKLKVGDPTNKDTDVGPLIDSSQLEKVEKWLTEAVENGAELLLGGKRLENHCFEPTILLNPSPDDKVSREEIFGPVICIYSFDKLEDAYQRANELELHFQAAVFTENTDIAMEAFKHINATAVMINDHTAFRADWMPFGGRDESGLGMGGINYSIEEMSRIKLLVINSSKI